MRVSHSSPANHPVLTSPSRRTLSKVSRVAARDSSRALATVQDLFVALCEDHTIYGTFRSMKGESGCG